MVALRAAMGRRSCVVNSPMVALRAAMGRRSCVVNLSASVRISSTLFISAKSGASGKAATKIVTKPNWITADVETGENSIANHM